MTEQRILLVGGVGVVKGRIREAGSVMAEICDEWEPHLRACDFVGNAPFKTVSLVIRFGESESEEPDFMRIDGRNRELPVSYEIPMARLRRETRERVDEEFRRVTKLVLLATAEKYGLAVPVLDAE